MSALRVVVADDTHLFRHGMVRLLQMRGVDVVGEASDADGLMKAVEEHRPDVAVVDVRMPPTGTDEGLRAAADIRVKHPCTGVLVLSGFVETAHLEHLLKAGAKAVGYLLKDRLADVDQLVEALHRVAAGGSALDPDVVAELFRRRRTRGPLDALTLREREILQMMAQGRSNGGIADVAHVSPKTVERHIGSIFSKLDLEETEEGHRRVLAVLRYLGVA